MDWLNQYIRERRRARADAEDLERINRAADELNSEALDVLEYQVLDNPPVSE
jgi:hypothetical protein